MYVYVSVCVDVSGGGGGIGGHILCVGRAGALLDNNFLDEGNCIITTAASTFVASFESSTSLLHDFCVIFQIN